jgi:hypothetical protein
MARVNIAFRVHPLHYRAIRKEIAEGKTLTGIFDEMLNQKYPITSLSIKN